MKKTIAVTEKIHAEVKTLCKTLDLEFGAFVEHSMLYFKKTGVNPSKSYNESPQKAIEELIKVVRQVVGFMKEHERKKLDPLHEALINLTNTLEASLKILPKSERFEQVIKGVNHHINLLVENHKKQMDFLKQSGQETMQENKTELGSLASAIDTLTEAVNGLKTEQEAIKEAIKTKLRKNILGG
jgi:hypothetical protein